jgi:hypothetical protein
LLDLSRHAGHGNNAAATLEVIDIFWELIICGIRKIGQIKRAMRVINISSGVVSEGPIRVFTKLLVQW